MSAPSPNYKNAVAALVAGVIVLTVVVALLVFNLSLQNSGQIGNVKTVSCAAFFDAGATQPAVAITWGTLSPDSSLNQTIYLKNTGNSNVNWTYTVSAWNPSNANTYMFVSVDFKNAVNTAPNAVIPVVVTNSVLANAPPNSSYSYSITLTASG